MPILWSGNAPRDGHTPRADRRLTRSWTRVRALFVALVILAAGCTDGDQAPNLDVRHERALAEHRQCALDVGIRVEQRGRDAAGVVDIVGYSLATGERIGPDSPQADEYSECYDELLFDINVELVQRLHSATTTRPPDSRP